jgi:class 3 adenylate cyclase
MEAVRPPPQHARTGNMKYEDLQQTARTISLFNGVADELIRQLTPDAHVSHYRDGDSIFKEGDSPDNLYVVLRGKVSILRNGTYIVTRGKTEVFGEQAIVDDTSRTATVKAVGSVQLLRVPVPLVKQFLHDPQFATNLLRILSEKLSQATDERAYRYALEEKLFAAFRSYIDPEVLNKLLATGLDKYGKPRFIDAIVLFCDMRSYSLLSLNLKPADVAEQLGGHLEAMVEVIHQHGGMVDKFVGDGVMAIWGFYPGDADDAERAFDCAVSMVETARLRTFAGRPIEIGVGLNQGTVFCGNVGNDRKRQFTVLGAPVNVASRLETLSKTLGAPIVIGQTVYQLLPGDVQARLTEHRDVHLPGIGAVNCHTYNLS